MGYISLLYLIIIRKKTCVKYRSVDRFKILKFKVNRVQFYIHAEIQYHVFI